MKRMQGKKKRRRTITALSEQHGPKCGSGSYQNAVLGVTIGQEQGAKIALTYSLSHLKKGTETEKYEKKRKTTGPSSIRLHFTKKVSK